MLAMNAVTFVECWHTDVHAAAICGNLHMPLKQFKELALLAVAECLLCAALDAMLLFCSASRCASNQQLLRFL
jgi:hypothetical protein